MLDTKIKNKIFQKEFMMSVNHPTKKDIYLGEVYLMITPSQNYFRLVLFKKNSEDIIFDKLSDLKKAIHNMEKGLKPKGAKKK